MLQFITKESTRYTHTEQARLAIEGGCRWVELNLDGPDQAVAEAAKELMPLCRDTDTFLILRRTEVVDALRVSGVFLDGATAAEASATRDRLGPHAVIGVSVATADDVLNLRRADIDYAVLPPVETLGADRYAAIVRAVRGSECTTAIVASGAIAEADVPAVMATGVSGIAVSSGIADAPDPVFATRAYLAALGL